MLFRYRPGQDLGFSGDWGSIICRQWSQEGGKVVSPTHRPSLPPGTSSGSTLCSHQHITAWYIAVSSLGGWVIDIVFTSNSGKLQCLKLCYSVMCWSRHRHCCHTHCHWLVGQMVQTVQRLATGRMVRGSDSPIPVAEQCKADRFLGLQIGIPPAAQMFVLYSKDRR
jgi:hypothetical protein